MHNNNNTEQIVRNLRAVFFWTNEQLTQLFWIQAEKTMQSIYLKRSDAKYKNFVGRQWSSDTFAMSRQQREGLCNFRS